MCLERVSSSQQHCSQLLDGRSGETQRLHEEGVSGGHTAGGGQGERREQDSVAEQIEGPPSLISAHTSQSCSQPTEQSVNRPSSATPTEGARTTQQHYDENRAWCCAVLCAGAVWAVC